MKRRHSTSKTSPNNQTNAMPIPGRMKIGIGGNSNKRHHWAPPSPQVNNNALNTTALGVPVPRIHSAHNNNNGLNKYNSSSHIDNKNNTNGILFPLRIIAVM